MIKVIVAFIGVALIFFSVYYFFNPRREFKPLYFAVVLFAISFSIALSHQTYRIVGEDLTLYIHFYTIVIFTLLLFHIRPTMLKPSVDWVFFIPLGIQAIISWRTELIVSLPDFLRLGLNYATIGMIMAIAKSAPKFSLRTFFKIFNYLAIFNGILSVAQIITKKSLLLGNADSSILYTEGIVDTFRAVGIAGSNNSAGNLACLLFVICLYNLRDKFGWLPLSGVVMSIVAALLAQTRIAFVGMAIAAFIWFFSYETYSRNALLTKYIMGILFVLGAMFVLGIEFDKIIQVFFSDRGSTQDARFSQYVNAWDFGLKLHPFLGIGMGQWRSYLYNFTSIVDIPIHSQYFAVLIENGIFAFAGFVLFNFSLAKKAFQTDKDNRTLRSFVVAFFIANFVVANFNPNQIYTVNIVIYYLVICLIAYYKKRPLSEFNLGSKKN